MSLAIDGLVSGLDTTSLINQLMTLEAAPQTLLKNKVTTTQSYLTALQGLNSSVAALATMASKTALPASTDLFTATSSATSVTATATTGAAAGQIDLAVTQVAKAQVTVSAAMAAWPASPATLTIVGADGAKTEITAASTSIADMATAINASGAGVKAVRVSSGTDSGGTQLYRLQLTSAKTGAEAAFTAFQGTEADVIAGTATDLLSATGAATVTSASDASVTLWAGTPAQQVLSSSTNTFADILPGVSVTVSKVEASPVALTIARDSAGVSALASNLVGMVGAVFSYIDSRSAVSTSTTSGTSKTTAGVFTGSSLARDLRTQFTTAVMAPVDGKSPSTIGISIARDGTVSYDSAKFSAALAADPAGTQAMMQEISSRVSAAATSASDKYTGSITKSITGQESALKSLDTQIDDWDVRLASQRSGLERIYSALEVQLSNLQAQSSWLTSQLAALDTSTS